METEKKVIYPTGLNVFLPRAGSPSFVIADISIHPQKFIEFLKENKQYLSDKGYFRLVMKKGRDDSYYMELDTWKPSFPPIENNRQPAPDAIHHSSLEGTVEYPESAGDNPF